MFYSCSQKERYNKITKRYRNLRGGRAFILMDVGVNPIIPKFLQSFQEKLDTGKGHF
jgi:hypothetical protein